jgi:pimeloyl-ACP methyl ester carboxylesterase
MKDINRYKNMKHYLLLLLCCFGGSLFGQTPPQPVSLQRVTMEEITFNNAGVSLSGTIYRPENPHAAVVIVHGSGQETRMLKIAWLLARNGLAVCTYDKRGVGKSGGVYAGPEVGTNNVDAANLNLLALDASAAANALLEHLPVKRGPLGLMGFSQAGWVIPIAANQNPRVNFMVLFSGPVVSTIEQLRFQFYTEGKSRFWDAHTEAEALVHIRSDTDRYQFADTDPQDVLGRLSIPGLWLFGGKDVQVPVKLSIENLSVLTTQGKRYSYQLFPELGHNTAFAKSQEPLDIAIKWIKDIDKHQ